MNTNIELAKEAGFVGYGEDSGAFTIPVNAFLSRIERFAELVRADQRERDARIAEEYEEGSGGSAAIRAGGQE